MATAHKESFRRKRKLRRPMVVLPDLPQITALAVQKIQAAMCIDERRPRTQRMAGYARPIETRRVLDLPTR